MEQHTPTPWKVSEKDWYVVSNRGHICEMMGPFGYEVNKANARRIAACVNACEGITTELLEQGSGFWEKSNSHDEERDAAFSDLLRVNARLLEVWKEMVNATSEDFAVTYGFGEQRDAAIGAIAKAEKTTTETSWNKNEKK